MKGHNNPPVAIIRLGRPISLNNAYANKSSGGRRATQRLRTWRSSAAAIARGYETGKAASIPSIKGPVRIELSVPEHRVPDSFDTDNCVKAYFDLLTHMGVIEDDNKTIIRSFSVHWCEGEYGQAVIYPIESGIPHREAA